MNNVLLTSILLFSILISVPKVFAASSSLVVRSSSSPSLATKDKYHQQIWGCIEDVHSPKWMDEIPLMLQSQYFPGRCWIKLERERIPGTPAPREVLKDWPATVFKESALTASSISLLSMFYLLITCHSPACHTRSNACLKSIKLWKRSCCPLQHQQIFIS